MGTSKKTASGGQKRRAGTGPRLEPRRFVLRWVWRLVLVGAVLAALAVGLYRAVNPPTTIYMMQESRRLGGIAHEWVAADAIAPVMYRAAVAAEDADFCRHWGFDMDAIRQAIEAGGDRGASTISQQVVKNVYLWHGRNWTRKALEAALTPAVEAVWPKRRILEVYLNVAEFGEGVFGIGAAAEHHFGVAASDLTSRQAALLAAVLPNPKERIASRPSGFVERRAASIRDGAATIDRDGRAACFQGG
ncbi:monofunctional biosynthetic peptidoglycan transglycosylase [Roseivivax sediminis]|uniref:Biosynthetic peptidoglycan transglycosylase n=1 Tax=Roseivivax sediminis TaxID=936889 RepID=A0A1I2B1C2_9RHOB|nr:monofunctional biosynthetic peptidoglycan transglycosylase [Roseivivax sediminis]SFE48960.1 monofunctional biosynthetic peptidoglycan transglycosylase [Roseivivax sediminis]